MISPSLATVIPSLQLDELASTKPCRKEAIPNHITTPLSPPLTPTEYSCPAQRKVLQFDDLVCSAASTPIASDRDDDLESNEDFSRSSPAPLEPAPSNIRRRSLSRPRRTFVKFSEAMEQSTVVLSYSSQARSRYQKPIPHGRNSVSSASIEGTVHFDLLELYRRDPKILLQPAVVSVPPPRRSSAPAIHAFSPSEPSTSEDHIGDADYSQQSNSHSDAYRVGSASEENDGSSSSSSIFEVPDESLGSWLRDSAAQPDMNVFDIRRPRIFWKGSPLPISHLPYFDLLHPVEAYVASTLRLTPTLYLKCRFTLLHAAREHSRRAISFRKSDAQKICRVDVNKTSRLWEVFGELGWLGEDWPGL